MRTPNTPSTDSGTSAVTTAAVAVRNGWATVTSRNCVYPLAVVSLPSPRRGRDMLGRRGGRAMLEFVEVTLGSGGGGGVRTLQPHGARRATARPSRSRPRSRRRARPGDRSPARTSRSPVPTRSGTPSSPRVLEAAVAARRASPAPRHRRRRARVARDRRAASSAACAICA